MRRAKDQIPTMFGISLSLFAIRLAVLIFTLSLFRPSEQITVELFHTPREVTAAITRNVTLRCEKKATNVGTTDSMRWFRIAKKSEGGWTNAVEYRTEGAVTNMTGATAVGYLSPLDWSGLLQATWTEATDDTIGVFRCEFFGVTSQNGYDVEYSNEVTFEETVNLDTLTKLWRDVSTESKNLASCPSYSAKFENKISTLGRHLDHKKTEAHETSWKHGRYSLLMPESGCPAPFMNESNSYLKFHEESSPKSSNSCLKRNEFFHLSKPVGENDGSNCFVNFRYCESIEEHVEVPWPDGQYCINNIIDNSCPAGFTFGSMWLNAEGTEHSSKKSGNTATFHDHQYYCCKNSGSHYTPMVMPTEKPFYLYRYGGACQMILGMGVTEEYIDINTKRDFRNDRVYKDHPDIDIDPTNPTIIHLCYYFKNDSY